MKSVSTSELIEIITNKWDETLRGHAEEASAELDARVPARAENRSAQALPCGHDNRSLCGPECLLPNPVGMGTVVKAEPERSALVDTLIALVSRAGCEIKDRRLREAYEADLVALLKDHGLDDPRTPVVRSTARE